MINITEFFIKHNFFLLVLVIMFFFGGLISFFNLNRNEDPGFKIRTATIRTDATGFDAKKVNDYISRPIEDMLLSMDEIEDIDSKSFFGQSVLFVHLYEKYKDIQPIWDKLRRRILLVQKKLPDNLNPVVNDEFGDVYGALIGVSIKEDNYEKLYDCAKKVKDEYLNLKSRGKVEIFGVQEEVINVYFKNSLLADLKISYEELANFIKASNALRGASFFETDKSLVQIKSKNEFLNIDDIKDVVLYLNERPIFLKDIFNVEKTVKTPITHKVRTNGKNGLVIGITLKENGNILNWGKEIELKTKELQEKYKDLNLEILALQSKYVKTLTDKFTTSLVESILAVILVVVLILGRNIGFIIGFIILADVLSVFFVMNCLNIGLDKISLSALIISLGILVDNSIVVAQGCLRSENAYKDVKKCITGTAYKFQIPLLIVTLTTALSFLPVYIAKSTVSEYTSSLFKVIFIALLFSWFYSLTLLPYLVYKFFPKNISNNRTFFLVDFIKNKIDRLSQYPNIIVFVGTILFFISFLFFSFVPKIFFPDSDRNMFEIKLNLRNGTNYKETEKSVIKTENYLKTLKGVVNFSSYIGISAPRYVLSASPDADSINSAVIIVNTKHYKDVLKNIKAVKEFINENLPNTQAIVRKIPLGPPYDAPLEIRIYENDIDKLFVYSKLISDIISKEKGVYLVKTNWGDFVPSYSIKINKNASAQAGLNSEELFDYLNTYYNGKKITYFYRDDIKIPVFLKGEDTKINPDAISIFSKIQNSPIPLSQVAKISSDYEYSRIYRRNNSYVLSVQGWLDDGISANDFANKISSKLNKISGLRYEFGGILEKSKKGNKSVMAQVPLAYSVIFLILVAYFNDIKKPFFVLLAGIMALSGANFALFLLKANFGFITFLGYICLVGICVNNGVILVNEISDNSLEKIVYAAKSRVEAILLTSFTTIGGMLPLWIKVDPMFSTLAISLIFGLFSSVLITLFFLPTVYFLASKNR